VSIREGIVVLLRVLGGLIGLCWLVSGTIVVIVVVVVVGVEREETLTNSIESALSLVFGSVGLVTACGSGVSCCLATK
jgi:hypothetical protein